MGNAENIARLKKDVGGWNDWRSSLQSDFAKMAEGTPDLDEAKLAKFSENNPDLTKAELPGWNLDAATTTAMLT